MYICENQDVFGLAVNNPLTTCEDTGMFTQDDNPPMCVQASRFNLMGSDNQMYFGLFEIKELLFEWQSLFDNKFVMTLGTFKSPF